MQILNVLALLLLVCIMAVVVVGFATMYTGTWEKSRELIYMVIPSLLAAFGTVVAVLALIEHRR